ncbi:N-acetylmuramoyl-L-alanine amidase [Patescibacteria group bacterium]|nr:N-acetylmuramoyl-L-alanine amidase [Patescibacteria group bacterium]
MYKLKTIKLFVLGTVAVMAIVVLSTQVLADTPAEVRSDELVISSLLIDEGSYLSNELITAYPFNVAGFAWRGDSEVVSVQLRFYSTDGWTKWYAPESGYFFEKDGWHYNTEPILAAAATKAQFKIEADNSIEAFRFIYIDSRQQKIISDWNLLDWLFNKVSAASELNIIPRADWVADEDWRFDAKDNEIWEPEYQSPQTFVVHHTAGSDGTDGSEDTIRGVYYWHAVVLGWGDIGYNYIIDQEGNIYEGRTGGDGVIGAHSYRSRTCAIARFGSADLEANFNRGTIGIAILGDYEDELTLNQAVTDALAELIGQKGAQFGIAPDESGYLIDDIYPNVSGHRDVDCTDCPGQNLFDSLDDIRAAAQVRFIALGGISGITSYDYSAVLEDQIIYPASYTGDTQTVTVRYKNVGRETWTQGEVKLGIYDLGDKISQYYDTSWPDVFGQINFAEDTVATNEFATFQFTFRSPGGPGKYLNIYRLTGIEDMIQHDDRSITRVDSKYQATLAGHNIPPALLNLWRPVITVKFKNTGLAIWDQHVTLEAFDLGNSVSRFRDKSWLGDYTTTRLNESSVKPGEYGTFTFRVLPPEPGLYFNNFYIQRWGKMVQDGEFSLITRVDGLGSVGITSISE